MPSTISQTDLDALAHALVALLAASWRRREQAKTAAGTAAGWEG